MADSWNDIFNGQFKIEEKLHSLGCSYCCYFNNDKCTKHNLERERYSRPCTDFKPFCIGELIKMLEECEREFRFLFDVGFENSAETAKVKSILDKLVQMKLKNF